MGVESCVSELVLWCRSRIRITSVVLWQGALAEVRNDIYIYVHFTFVEQEQGLLTSVHVCIMYLHLIYVYVYM
jgi:hypothetical protein